METGTIRLPHLELGDLEGSEPWTVVNNPDAFPGLREAIEELDRMMLPLVRRPEPTATWVNVLSGAGAEVPPHREGMADGDMTAILFLTDALGGELVVDGEPVEPEPGRWVSFPSDTPHAVAPLDGGTRVSVAALYRVFPDGNDQ